MSLRGFRWRLSAVLVIGVTLGALWLLEPLTRFWDHFHLLGLSWPTLLGLYLGTGLALTGLGALGVELVARSAQWLPVSIFSYYATAAACLSGAVILAPFLRRELLAFRFAAPVWLVVPVLIACGALLTLKITPRLIIPLAHRLIGRPDGRVALSKLTVLLLVILPLIPLAIWKGDLAGRHPAGRPARSGVATRPSQDPVQNVLLITVESLRADHLGAYGYPRATSPNLDAFASGAILFEQCFAQGNTTELSFGSLFTSLYPSTHNVRRHNKRASPLALEVETLAEHLRDAGLRTAGMMANPFLKREWNLTQGFDRICEFHYAYLDLLPVIALRKLHLHRAPERIPPADIPRGGTVVDQAIGRLQDLHDRPFFLFVHLMDTHHPYSPPQPFAGMFVSPGASTLPPLALWRRSWSAFAMLPSENQPLPPADLLRMIDLYDGAIRYVDQEIGRLLAEVDRLNLTDRTLIILTSDHGEEFLDHGDVLHKSPWLYDELTHVPLIIHCPGVARSGRETALVRHIDLLPTALELLDLPASDEACGSSLVPLLHATGTWSPVAAFSQSYACIAVRTPERKLMHNLRDDRGFCFDLLDDPGELRNIYPQAPACDSLEKTLIDFLKRSVAAPPAGSLPQEIDPHTLRVLGSLGYVDM
ncbi:MAG: sulfatase [Candidatus Eisenbacteria bacterium]